MSSTTTASTPVTVSSVTRVLLAEFDIDVGSSLRVCVSAAPTTGGEDDGKAAAVVSLNPADVDGVDSNTLAELMLPEGMHHRGNDWTLFFLNRHGRMGTPFDDDADDGGAGSGSGSGAGAGAGKDSGGDGGPRFMYCLSVVQSRREADARRGAVVRSIAVCSRYPFVDQFQSILFEALDKYADSQSNDILQSLCSAIDGVDMSSCPRLSRLDRILQRGTLGLPGRSLGSVLPSAGHVSTVWKAELAWRDQTFHLRVPLLNETDAVADASLVRLTMRFGPALMDVFNAVLMGKRVLFFGDKSEAAGDVASCVIAACLLVSPPLTGIARRAFPYTSLTQLEFLEVPGYIAGVTNPMFVGKTQWWDVLCNVGTGEVTTADRAGDSTRGGSMPADGQPIVGAGSTRRKATKTLSPSRTDGSVTGPSSSAPGISPSSPPPATSSSSLSSSSSPPPAASSSSSSAAAAAVGSAALDGTSPRASGRRSSSVVSPPRKSLTAEMSNNGATATTPSNTKSPSLAKQRRATVSSRALLSSAAGSGTSASSSTVFRSPSDAKWKAADGRFAARVLSGARFGEHWLREMFTQYTQILLNLCTRFVKDKGRHAPSPALVENLDRVRAIVATPAFKEYMEARHRLRGLQGTCFAPPAPNFHTLRTHVAQLKSGRPLPPDKSLALFQDLTSMVETDADLEALTSMFPETVGGLHSIGAGLLHPSQFVRDLSCRLLRRIERHPNPVVRAAFNNLNSFTMLAYARTRETVAGEGSPDGRKR